MAQQKRNAWFEETFLPSLEARMNNPKYPYQVILSERQEIICLKYMKEVYDNHYVYKIGTKEFDMSRRGRYIFMNLYDSSKEIWFLRNNLTQEDIITFKTHDELQAWMDANEEDDIGTIRGIRDYTAGMRYEM